MFNLKVTQKSLKRFITERGGLLIVQQVVNVSNGGL
jgi:hypothetical protein